MRSQVRRLKISAHSSSFPVADPRPEVRSSAWGRVGPQGRLRNYSAPRCPSWAERQGREQYSRVLPPASAVGLGHACWGLRFRWEARSSGHTPNHFPSHVGLRLLLGPKYKPQWPDHTGPEKAPYKQPSPPWSRDRREPPPLGLRSRPPAFSPAPGPTKGLWGECCGNWAKRAVSGFPSCQPAACRGVTSSTGQ